MSFPKSVKFLGYTYKIVKATHETAKAGCSGLFDAEDQLIHIHDHGSNEKLAETLIHELIHMIDYHFDTGLEETQVHRLSNGVFGVLRANKEIITLLSECN